MRACLRAEQCRRSRSGRHRNRQCRSRSRWPDRLPGSASPPRRRRVPAASAYRETRPRTAGPAPAPPAPRRPLPRPARKTPDRRSRRATAISRRRLRRGFANRRARRFAKPRDVLVHFGFQENLPIRIADVGSSSTTSTRIWSSILICHVNLTQLLQLIRSARIADRHHQMHRCATPGAFACGPQPPPSAPMALAHQCSPMP